MNLYPSLIWPLPPLILYNVHSIMRKEFLNKTKLEDIMSMYNFYTVVNLGFFFVGISMSFNNIWFIYLHKSGKEKIL